MAKTIGFLSQTSGKLDDNFTTRQTAFGTVLARNARKASKVRRSEKQANQRCQMANMSANFRLHDGKLAQAFENKGVGLSEFNMYVQTNWGTANATYITKQERIAGACVLAEYKFSVGSLPPIDAQVNAGGVLVSDISLGSLVIGSATTIAELAIAVQQNNSGWEDGDQLTFFDARQWVDSAGVPRASMVAQKVVLDTSNETKLWDVTGARGFTSVTGGTGYVLGMNTALANAGAAWVHSREKESGNIKVSSQHMVVVSEILAQYQTYEAMVASANSYGGINTKAVYLNPASKLADIGVGSVVVTPAGGGSGSGSSGTGSGGTGGSGSGSGSQTGGGGQTTTVATPTFAGETQFTETTQVTMSAEAGASIHYTTDGSTPTAASTVYSGPLTLSDTTTVKAVAVKDGVSSSVTSRTYTKGSNAGGGGGTGNDEN